MSAWKIKYTLSQRDFVLKKFLKLEWFDQVDTKTDNLLAQNCMDAVAMKQLTGTAAVVYIHGYYGTSLTTEFAAAQFTTMSVQKDMAPVRKLDLATKIAIAGKEMHSIGLAYNDLYGEFIVFRRDHANGNKQPILNDFNLVAFSKRQNKTGKTCSIPRDQTHPSTWKPPEYYLPQFNELLHPRKGEDTAMFDNGSKDAPVRIYQDKFDVYTLGRAFSTGSRWVSRPFIGILDYMPTRRRN